MFKLLRADFSRLIKHKTFIVLCILLALFSAYINYGTGVTIKETRDFIVFPFETLAYLSFIISAFVALFTGTNFTDGIIRNKLFSGHSKAEIFLSNTIVCSVASSVLTAILILSGIWLVFNKLVTPVTFLSCILVSIITSVSFSVFASFCTFICRGKTVPLIMTAVILAGMFLTTSKLGEALSETEYTDEIESVNGVPIDELSDIYISDSTKITYKTVKNARFIPDGAKRNIMEKTYRFMPTTQFMSVASIEYTADDLKNAYYIKDCNSQEKLDSPEDAFEIVNVAYCFAFIAIFTCAGIVIFRKEDVK